MCDGPRHSSGPKPVAATPLPPPSARARGRNKRGAAFAAPLSAVAMPSPIPQPIRGRGGVVAAPRGVSPSPVASAVPSPFSPAARSSRGGSFSNSAVATSLKFSTSLSSSSSSPSPSPSPSPSVSGSPMKSSRGGRDSQRGGSGSSSNVRLSRLEMERAQRSALKSSSAVGGTQSRVSQAVKEALEQERIRSEERLKEEQQLLESRIREETERTTAQLQAAQSAAQRLRSQLAASSSSSSSSEKRPVRIMSSKERRQIQEARQSAFQASEKARQEEYNKRMGSAARASSASASSTLPGAPFSPVTELDQLVVSVYMNRPANVHKDKKLPKVPLKKLQDGKYMFGTKVVQVKSEFGEVFVNSAPGTTFGALLDQLEALEARKMQALGAARGIIVA